MSRTEDVRSNPLFVPPRVAGRRPRFYRSYCSVLGFQEARHADGSRIGDSADGHRLRGPGSAPSVRCDLLAVEASAAPCLTLHDCLVFQVSFLVGTNHEQLRPPERLPASRDGSFYANVHRAPHGAEVDDRHRARWQVPEVPLPHHLRNHASAASRCIPYGARSRRPASAVDQVQRTADHG